MVQASSQHGKNLTLRFLLVCCFYGKIGGLEKLEIRICLAVVLELRVYP